MKVVFELNHPAHFHLFKNTAFSLEKNGHEIAFVVKEKDVLLNLIRKCSIEAVVYSRTSHEKKKGFIGNLLWLIESDIKFFNFCRKFKPDIMLGSNFSFTHIGKLMGIPTLLWAEDDAKEVILGAKISYPFATTLFAPVSCNNYKWENKSIKYPGYHELAYLHPNHFNPEIRFIEKYIDTTKPYYLLRFSKLTAHHDSGKSGITSDLAQKLINILNPHGTVYITSEGELESQFETYRLSIDPQNIHHAMYFANIYIGDSQTMAAEAAVLGTPSFRFNDFVGKLGYLNELENKYNLTYGIKTNHPQVLVEKISRLLENDKLKKEWITRRENMLVEKIDVAEFMTWVVENYPHSIQTIKNNPEYQYNLK